MRLSRANVAAKQDLVTGADTGREVQTLEAQTYTLANPAISPRSHFHVIRLPWLTDLSAAGPGLYRALWTAAICDATVIERLPRV